MSEELLYFNGINARTGQYELQPLPAKVIAGTALGQPIDEKWQDLLKQRKDRAGEERLGINADPRDLAKTGWGVIFSIADKRAPAILEALRPLLDLRREQATKEDARYYREFVGEEGYYPKEDAYSHLSFLGRPPRRAGPGSVEPEKVPYYLLLVGDPETISYEFQYQLDVQYAVGRIHFATIDEYARYAESVVAAETGKVRLPRQATFFGARSEDDRATIMSADNLVKPLAASRNVADKHKDWTFTTVLAADAKKERLGQVLGGKETPAFLFTASHGMGFPNGDELQLRHQGALLCSNWPGPREWQNPIPEDFYFSADDVPDDARLLGTLAFFFACYGAGTPKLDAFAHRVQGTPAEIAPYPFVAGLPRRLLGHPKGSALAVVGHVERAWGYSFAWGDAGPQLRVFEDTMDQLLSGYPIGAAIEWFNVRHAELSVVLTGQIDRINNYGLLSKAADLAAQWIANNDARSYVILGDPAVRLPVARGDEHPKKRPVVELSAERKAKLAELNFPEPVSAPEPAPPPAEKPTPPPMAAQSQGATTDYAVAFGMGEQFTSLTGSLKTFTAQLADALGKAAVDILTLEVATYSAADLAAVARGDTQDARLRAYTRVEFDGDMKVYVPEKSEGGVDQEVWGIHMQTVREAQENRAKFMQAMAELATNLLKSLKL